jgi:hypothetical protein
VNRRIYRDQVATLLGNLDRLGQALRGVEGRKQILYFSAGFDSKALIGATGSEMRTTSEALVEGRIYEVDSDRRYGDQGLRGMLAKAARSISNADCLVHTIDVTGLGTDNSLTQTTVSGDLSRELDGRISGRESLNFLSKETGGRFFKDTNDLDTALAEVLDMTSRYYILAYQPTRLKGPGHFHKLKVKVRRKKAKLSHRAGYYERVPVKSQTYLQKQFETAQLLMTGVGPSDLDFSALCFAFPNPGERQTLGLVVQVPREQIRSSGTIPLEIYAYPVGTDGLVPDHLAQLARIDPARIDPSGTALGFSFYGVLQVPPGRYTLKLMLRETESGSSGVQFLEVTVPPHDPQAGYLLPPVIMDDVSQWLAVEMGAARTGRPAFPFTLEGRPFLPRASFRVRGGTPETLVVIAYQPDRPGDPAADLAIHSSVTDASGASVPAGSLSIDAVHRQPGRRRTYVLSYTPEALATGDYTLRIGISEAGTRLEAHVLLRVDPGLAIGAP